VRLLAHKLCRISKELKATNQKVGCSDHPGRTIFPVVADLEVPKIPTRRLAMNGAPGEILAP
jgi:hypothetical protein